MPATLDRIEETLGRIVDQPLAQTLAELGILADEDPANPAPNLAIAMVSSFSQNDFTRAMVELQTASERLRGADAADEEIRFSQGLYDAISSVFGLLQVGADDPLLTGDALRNRIQQVAAIHADIGSAIAKVRAAVQGLPDSSLAAVVLAALEALVPLSPALPRPSPGPDHDLGVQSLTELRSTGGSQPLAAFFLVYAYRAVRDYNSAISSGEWLEQRHPSSALVKQVIGSCYFYQGDYQTAKDYYLQAYALGPNASISLGLARMQALVGGSDNLREARDLAQRAESVDKSSAVTAGLEGVQRLIERQEHIQALSGPG
jgi:tetratricopeptide (TPR) repeat protein